MIYTWFLGATSSLVDGLQAILIDFEIPKAAALLKRNNIRDASL